jgi:acyl-CoA dehydrogenase
MQTIRQRLSRRLAEVGGRLVHHTAARCQGKLSPRSRWSGVARDLVNQVLYDCVQFHGGMGFVRETAVERMARDARVQAIGGAPRVMLEEIAKRFGAVLAD